MDDDGFQELLERSRGGDPQAFGELYRAIHPGLLRFLTSLGPGQGEDAASDTWLDVASHLDEFHGDASGFRGWVFTIGRRRVIDQARREGRRAAQSWPDDAAIAAFSPDAAEILEQAEATRAALALVASLSPDQAEVVLLRVLAGLNNAEVAAVLGKNPGAVRVLAHRGLQRLRRTLERTSMREEV